ncbi:radical SAM protein [Chryseobacterium sp. MEBOG06]|uniref:radical SAM/SPASM domain-containing protein n=1 Tax=Chryseobacterium sp. MEBOG06 TaxID=2879938 RepID=UPI001F030197|nr:radical SAM protein [Chryseobacterium sp. MEBOG06]UKB84717.1 radical SAM protein [Chryseobacterium sp. MEBOG06]
MLSQKYKASPYNLLIPIEETEEFLLYNTFLGGIEILTQKEGILLSELMSLQKIYEDRIPSLHKDLFKYLLSKDYIIKEQDFINFAENLYLKRKKLESANGIYLTIGTTITCNMACPYCFEFHKPKDMLKDQKTFEKIVSYLQEILSMERNIKKLFVTWYGGEPLLNMKAIKSLSPMFIELCEKNNIAYETDLITNGIFLTPENVKILQENAVNQAQVTLDGAQETHDKYRPLKKHGDENYTKILENLSLLPDNFQINLRMNIDKEVAKTIPVLLSDLQKYNIWPAKYRSFSFSPAWLRTYDGEIISEQEKKKRLTVDEFFEVKQNFRFTQIKIFNEWATNKNIRTAKLAWELPQFQSDCPTWVSPYGLVIDPLGNIHKCWETIHEAKKAPSNVFEGYKKEHFKDYTDFNRYNVNEICRNCKFLPVCDQISCSHQALKNTIPQCTYWKYKAEDFIKEQYLRLRSNPEQISSPVSNLAINTGHTNK